MFSETDEEKNNLGRTIVYCENPKCSENVAKSMEEFLFRISIMKENLHVER